MGSRRSGNRRKWVQEERGRGENTPRVGTEERETEEKKGGENSGNRGREREERKKMRKDNILGVVKKINKYK